MNSKLIGMRNLDLLTRQRCPKEGEADKIIKEGWVLTKKKSKGLIRMPLDFFMKITENKYLRFCETIIF